MNFNQYGREGERVGRCTMTWLCNRARLAEWNPMLSRYRLRDSTSAVLCLGFSSSLVCKLGTQLSNLT